MGIIPAPTPNMSDWVTYPGSPVLGHLSWVICPGSPVLGHLSWLTCPGTPVQDHLVKGGNIVNSDTSGAQGAGTL